MSQSDEVRPLALFDAERALKSQRRLSPLALQDHRPAEIRPLPFPFTGYCTLSSDADGLTYEGLISFGVVVRERLGLPISDSIFPHFLFNRGFLEPEGEMDPGVAKQQPDLPPSQNFSLARFISENHEWMRGFHKGWTDTIHGWLLRIQVQIGDDIVIQNRPSENPETLEGRREHYRRQASRAKEFLRTKLGLTMAAAPGRVRFRIPDGWHLKVAPRYFIFRYRNPTYGSWVKLEFLDGKEVVGTVDLTDIPNGAPLMLTSYVVDLHRVVGTDPELLKRIEIHLRCIGVPHALELRDPVLVTWTRADLAEQIALMEKLNLQLSTYTSHGGGYNIGHNKTVALDSADCRGMAENPEVPYFALDLFREFGLEFFNSTNNTSQKKLMPVHELVVPKVLNNGMAVQDFDRYLFMPDQSAGTLGPFEEFGSAGNASLGNFVGWQIDHLIDTLSGNGDGGLIYTHIYAKAPRDPNRRRLTPDMLFNTASYAALERLARSYYGLPTVGQGRSNSDPRVFVAPSSALLRLSQISRELRHHAFYDAERNEVHVESWIDPLTGSRVPDPLGGYRQLRFSTFYVNCSATARVRIDGKPYEALIRSPADQTGRESVTVADVGTPTLITGKIFIGDIDGLAVNTSELTAEPVDHGAGTGLRLEAQEGRLVLAPTLTHLANHHYLLLRLAGSCSKLELALEITTDDGLKLAVCSPGWQGMGHAKLVAPLGPEPERVTWVLPFHSLVSAGSAAETRMPVGRLERVDLRIRGEKGNTYVLEELSLLRDDDRPYRTEHVVGGKLFGCSDIDQIVAGCAGDYVATPALSTGHYVFMQKFPRGSVLRLEARRRDGSIVKQIVHEVVRDTLEVDFVAEVAGTT